MTKQKSITLTETELRALEKCIRKEQRVLIRKIRNWNGAMYDLVLDMNEYMRNQGQLQLVVGLLNQCTQNN